MHLPRPPLSKVSEADVLNAAAATRVVRKQLGRDPQGHPPRKHSRSDRSVRPQRCSSDSSTERRRRQASRAPPSSCSLLRFRASTAEALSNTFAAELASRRSRSGPSGGRPPSESPFCLYLCGNQPVSPCGDDAAALASSSGEEPTSPRHRAGTRRPANAPQVPISTQARHSLHLLFSFLTLSMTSAAFSCCCLW